MASSSSATKAAKRLTARRLSRSRASSPNMLSDTGASIPAATSEAASPHSGSTTTTPSPADAARQAIAAPMTPAPATTTSAEMLNSAPFAGITRIRFDGRRPQPPSQPLPGAPVGRIMPTTSVYVGAFGTSGGDWMASVTNHAAGTAPADTRARLAGARLYLCTGSRRATGDLAQFLDAVLPAGVDIVQLREKGLEAREE